MYSSSVTKVLGGRKTLGRDIRTPFDRIRLSRKGVPKAALLHLAKGMGSSLGKMAELLPVTERTLQRHSPESHLNRVVSETVLHLAEVVARGAEVFEDKDRFVAWLALPNSALGGATPRDLLKSRFGIEMVLDELGRMEHGLVS